MFGKYAHIETYLEKHTLSVVITKRMLLLSHIFSTFVHVWHTYVHSSLPHRNIIIHFDGFIMRNDVIVSTRTGRAIVGQSCWCLSGLSFRVILLFARFFIRSFVLRIALRRALGTIHVIAWAISAKNRLRGLDCWLAWWNV